MVFIISHGEFNVVKWREWLREFFGWGRRGDTNFREDLNGHWEKDIGRWYEQVLTWGRQENGGDEN